MTGAALLPRLTALDRRVLDALPAADEGGKRARDTFTAPRVQRWGWDAAAAYEEHCAVLRGLEAVGLARCAGGWWRRV